MLKSKTKILLGGVLTACLLSFGANAQRATIPWDTNSSATPDNQGFRYQNPRMATLTEASNHYSIVAGTDVARDPRIDELARALGDYASQSGDIDRIYEFVRNHIVTTPSFGLTKGAFGTMMDGEGTPFDQAHLMVQLLEATGNYSPQYVYGQISINGAQFSEWFGARSDRGVCEILAAGGIPGTINGATPVDCANISASNSSLTSSDTIVMQHMWVAATVGGSVYHFDPSFKLSTWYEPVSGVQNAVTAPSNWRAIGGSLGTYSGSIEQASGYSASDRNSLRSTLAGFVDSAETALDTAEASTVATEHEGNIAVHDALSMRQTVGGGDIERAFLWDSSTGLRQASLPYATASQIISEIPNDLRTFVNIRLDSTISGAGEGGTNSYTETGAIDAAALAGRRISATRGLMIAVDEEIIAPANETPSTIPEYVPIFAYVSIDHPYIPGVNDGFDSTYSWRIGNALTSYVGLTFGGRGNGAEMRNVEAISRTGIANTPFVNPCTGVLIGGTGDYGTGPTVGQAAGEDTTAFNARAAYITGLYTYLNSAGNSNYATHEDPQHPSCEPDGWVMHLSHPERQNSKVALLESFMSNSSQMLDLYDGLAEGRRVQHHLIGFATSNIALGGRGEISSDQLAISFAGSYGFAPFDDQGRSREAYAFASATGLAALERTVMQANSDAPSVNGSATMFDWFLTETDEDRVFRDTFTSSFGNTDRRFFEVTSTSEANTVPFFGPVGTNSFDSDLISDGFTLIAPQSGHLGPVRNSLRWPDEHPVAVNGVPQIEDEVRDFDAENTWRTRARAFVAFNTTDPDDMTIAPFAGMACQQSYLAGCYFDVAKGSGGAEFPTGIEAPTAEREALDERYETWATTFDVDMRTGGVTLTPPADLVTGAGGSPYSLAFQRTYNSDRGRESPLGWGWTHNWDISLQTSTDISAGLGEHAPRHALHTIVAIEATLALFDDANMDELRDVVAAQLIMAWWSDAMFDNQAMLRRGPGSERFFYIPCVSGNNCSNGGRYVSEGGVNNHLYRTGTRTAPAKASPPNWSPLDPNNPDTQFTSISETFDRSGWDFTYVGDDGRIEVFDYQHDYSSGDWLPDDLRGYLDNNPTIGSVNRFRPQTITWPSGMQLTFTYDATDGLLSSVSNNATFGRTLNFYYEENPADGYLITNRRHDAPDGYGPYRRLTLVNDGTRSVQFGWSGTGDGVEVNGSQTLTSVIDVMGAVTRYGYLSEDTHTVAADTPYTTARGTRVRIDEVRLPHDPNNAFISLTYDNYGRARQITDADNRSDYYYVGEGARAAYRDRVNWYTHSFYDQDGRNYATETPRNYLQQTVFDGLGRSIESYWTTVYPGNALYRFRRSQTFYNAFGNAVIQRRPPTQYNGTDYSGSLRETVTTYGYSYNLSAGGQTTSVFRSLPTATSNPRGYDTSYCYDGNQSGCTTFGLQSNQNDGLLRRSLGSSGEETRVQYTTFARVMRTDAEVGGGAPDRVTTMIYGANGLPASTTVDPGGLNLTTIFAWDGNGNLDSVTDPGGRRARGIYRADRRLTQMISADQSSTDAGVTRFRYDASHRLQYVDQAQGVAGSSPNIAGFEWITTEVEYDDVGRTQRIIDPDGDYSQFTYYYNGLLYRLDENLTTGSSPSGQRRTQYQYAGDGSLYCEQVAHGTPDVRARRAQYTSFEGTPYWFFTGNHVSTTTGWCSPDQTYNNRVNFDNYYEPTNHFFPDGTYNDWDSDAAGNITYNRTRAGQVHNMVYDASDRLTSAVYPEGTQTYTYNLAGETTLVQWDAGSNGSIDNGVAYVYDNAGRLVSETRVQDNLATSYQYDASGNRTAIIWPDGWAAVYLYDGASRLTHVCEDADNNGTCEIDLATYDYDRLGRRTQTEFFGPVNSGTSGIDYYYEADSDLVRLEHQFDNAIDVTFAHRYEASGRLVASAANQPNWLWSAGTAFTRSYANDFSVHPTDPTEDLDQVEGWVDSGGQSGSWVYLYDANGNLSNTPTSLYNHDSRNRLTSWGSWNIEDTAGWNPASGGSTWQSGAMIYDPNGRRIVRTSTNSANLTFVHAGDMEIADVDHQPGSSTNGAILVRYVPGAAIDERVAMITTNPASCVPPTTATCTTASREAYHADRQGNVIAMISQAGTVNAKYVYTPFGVEDPINNSGNQFRYTGRRIDVESGLYYYRARYYDAALGRFIQTDPVLYLDQMNLYSYVYNNPLNGTDPSGECGPATAVCAGAGAGCMATGPFCPVGAAVGAGVGLIASVGVAIWMWNEISDDGPQSAGDSLPEVQGVLDGSTEGRPTKGRTRQRERDGGMTQADEDFDNITEEDTREDRGNGIRTGQTSDGRGVTVRPNSSDGRPTLQIPTRPGGRRQWEIRYNNNTAHSEQESSRTDTAFDHSLGNDVTPCTGTRVAGPCR